MKTTSRNNKRVHRSRRIRAKISGTATCPRLVVFRSLRDMRVQVIDDTKGVTLAAASLADLGKNAKNTVESAEKIGTVVAKKCKDAKVTTVVFDRGGYKYHGKVRAIAEGARSAGLVF